MERHYCIVQIPQSTTTTVVKKSSQSLRLLHKPPRIVKKVEKVAERKKEDTCDWKEEKASKRLRIGDVQKEMSNDDLISLFSSNSIPNTNQVDQKENVVESSRNRFLQFVEEEDDNSDDSLEQEKSVQLVSSSKAGTNSTAKKEIELEPRTKSSVPESQRETGFQKASRFTPLSETNVQMKKKKQLHQPRPSIKQPTNQWNLTFDIYQRSQRLYRSVVIPTTFTSVPMYQQSWKNAILESIQLQISDIAANYGRFFSKIPKSNLESYFRSKRIPFYEQVSLTTLNNTSFERMNHITMQISNKEHHSVYSKGMCILLDDIWIVSSSLNFEEAYFFLSYYYGPSSSCIELAPFTLHGEYKKLFDKKCYAIRLLNVGSEAQMLNMLEREVRMLPYLFGPPKSLQKGIVLKPNEFQSLVSASIQHYHLNAGQANALESFCRSLVGDMNPVLLVHGVYGAGKSFLLSVLIMTLHNAYENRFLETNTKIAFASLTNVAVDRVLSSLLEMKFTDFVRVGSLRKIAKCILPFTCHKSEQNSLKELESMLYTETLSEKEQEYIRKSMENTEKQNMLQDAFLIGITTLATNFGIVQDIECPIVILDECSQMTEPMSLLPIAVFQSKYCMCVGDPKQLPPTLSHSIQNGHGLETTLFERLANTQHEPVLLNTQYRCHPAISEISNSLFYNGKLCSGVSEDKRNALVPGLGPISFVSLDSQESRTGGSFNNSMEARTILSITQGLIRKGVEPSQIGIISLYKGQVSYLKTHLKEQNIPCLCATVDSFQGAEMDVIIVSTVRMCRSDFLEDERRINVALTRAKRHLIMVASDKMVKQSKLWNRIQRLCVVTDPVNLLLQING